MEPWQPHRRRFPGQRSNLLQPPAHRCPPPNECYITALVSQQLAEINGKRDPLGARLPYDSFYRAYLSASKQQQLLQLVEASVPHCIEWGVEQRHEQARALEVDLQAASSDQARRAQAGFRPLDIRIDTFETRDDAKRRVVLQTSVFY